MMHSLGRICLVSQMTWMVSRLVDRPRKTADDALARPDPLGWPDNTVLDSQLLGQQAKEGRQPIMHLLCRIRSVGQTTMSWTISCLVNRPRKEDSR